MESLVLEKPNAQEIIGHVRVGAVEDEGAAIAAAQNGHIASFEVLIQRYEKKILLRALRITRNWQDAEDVKQQSILKAFTHLRHFQGKSSFFTWLVRIAINESLMLLRRKRTSHEVAIENACKPDGEKLIPRNVPQIPLPDEAYLLQERKRILCAALKQLTPAMRTAIQLREVEELSTRETARILGISISATKSRVFQGRRRLRQLLDGASRTGGVRGRSACRRIKRTKRTQFDNNRANIQFTLRRQPIQHSHNSYPFPLGMSQAPQIPMEGGM